ncbi:MAG: hypothetical protein RRY47_06370 [Oscillospiraceae bacterium]
MKSKTSFFNSTLAFGLLKRFWPIFAGYLLIWLVVLPVSLATNLSGRMDNQVLDTAYTVIRIGATGGIVMSSIFGLFIAMAAFSYLYNARSVSMMCALPVRREGVIASVLSSGIICLFVCNLIVFLATLGVEAIFGMVSLPHLLQWLGIVCLTNVFFLGFAALCASFTGHILVLPLVYIVLNFTAFVVQNILRSLMSTFIYGFTGRGEFSGSFLSPIVGMISNGDVYQNTSALKDGTMIVDAVGYDGWVMLGIYALIGVIFALTAMLLVKLRRMESATDVVALRPLKPIFKYCFTLGVALVVGYLAYVMIFNSFNYPNSQLSPVLFLIAFMLLGAIVGYFSAEMLLQKTLRVFGGRHWIGLGITSLLIVGIILCGEFDVFGFERRLPDPAMVEAVQIRSDGDSAQFSQPENIEAIIKLQDSIIKNKNFHESPRPNETYSCSYAEFTYHMKDDSTFRRNYVIYYPGVDDLKTLVDILNTREALENRNTVTLDTSEKSISYAYVSYFDENTLKIVDLELSPAQAAELYNSCIVPDLKEGTIGLYLLNLGDNNYDETVYSCTVYIEFVERTKDENDKFQDFNSQVTVDAKRTAEFLKGMGLNLKTSGEADKLLGLDKNDAPLPATAAASAKTTIAVD